MPTLEPDNVVPAWPPLTDAAENALFDQMSRHALHVATKLRADDPSEVADEVVCRIVVIHRRDPTWLKPDTWRGLVSKAVANECAKSAQRTLREQKANWRLQDECGRLVHRGELPTAARTHVAAGGAVPDLLSAASADSDIRMLQGLRLLRFALARMTPRRRAIVIYRKVFEMEVEDIAATVHLAPATVRWHLSKGDAELDEIVAAMEDGAAPPADTPERLEQEWT